MSSNRQQNDDGNSDSTKKAKQRASIKWLLSKAYNNRVPEQLRDPFYTDHDGILHLKPQIVVGLGNASIYCQVLANIYSDPNYQSLNHWSILQTLCRKGVPILDERAGEPPLTETVLIQTNPLRINAHLAVIEALMMLYAKEVTSGEKISSAISRLTSGTIQHGQNSEQLLLLWVSHVMAALKHRLDTQLAFNEVIDEKGKKLISPDIPTPIQDYASLCDGVCIAYLIAFYSPKYLPWNQVRISYLPTIEDSIHNILLLSNFSQQVLPYSVFHMTPEDITYMRGHMKQNLVVLLADLFNLFEIHPAQCVDYPEAEVASGGISEESKTNEHGIAHRRGFTSQTIQPIPDLRSGLNSPPSSAGLQGRPPFQVIRSPSATIATNVYRHHTPPKELPTSPQYQQPLTQNNGNSDNDFIVHRSKGITTLFNMQDPLIPAKLRQSKEKTNNDTKSDERGVAAGRPSNWEEQRRQSFAGRRSRRNSFSEDSQLTIENFGGSQDQINMIGTVDRRFERERKISNASTTTIEPTLPARSSIADARGTLQIGYESDNEKEDKETEKSQLKRQNSDASSSNHSGVANNVDKRKMSSFASLTPSTTTWQAQQSMNSTQVNENRDNNQPLIDDSKLSAVRLKLEEKRRLIEKEKRKMETQMAKQIQKVGKAAFLQAINKREKSEESKSSDTDMVMVDSLVDKPVSLQDIPSLERDEWNQKFPDSEHNNNISLEQYQQSIALMNCDLHDIQDDIQKLAKQQNQIQVQAMQAQQLFQAQQIANILNQQYSSQQNIAGIYHPIQQQQFGSTPHIPMKPPPHHQYVNDQGQYINQTIYSRENSRIIDDQYAVTSPPMQYLNQEKQRNIAKYVQETNNYRDQYDTQQAQFFLHQEQPQTPPQPPARRTWSQKAPAEMSSWSQQAHQQQQQQQQQHQMQMQMQINQQPQQQSWKSSSSSASQSEKGFLLHQNGKSAQEGQAQRLFPVQHAAHQAPSKSVPNDDMMAPQSISFIGDEEDVIDDEPDNFNHSKMDELEVSLGKLNITSGSRTYRIPSPTTRHHHPGLAVNSFQSIESQNDENEKGFYISFDNDTPPKRPKPPLRTKRSPKKLPVDELPIQNQNMSMNMMKNLSLQDVVKEDPFKDFKVTNNDDDRLRDNLTSPRPRTSNVKDGEAIIIPTDELNPERVSVDEMERRKEKIMLLSLQRRQQQEEAKARKEIEAMQRRERESMKDEEKNRKKEEQIARRQQILEQHRLKKAIDEAEREGKTLDRHTTELLMKQQQLQQQQHMSTPQPKMRAVKSQRPRPKTIHVETNSNTDISGSLGKKGSSSNLTGIGLSSQSNTLRRDYYRGSQDSLSIKESPDEYPSTSSTPFGRRSSYKYGKEPGIERGRTLTRITSVNKYGGAGANFRGRKSNSLMNLCGDSDSGLGRATPPRRAASPGMGSASSTGRHLPSPSGPGSLPHPSLMKRRGIPSYDDGASDISSTPSSIFENYNGPRLYKQPAMKSNRGILLNAVEYCVFPGVVNREAKQKVLEKIARSEAKHFLVLFRDAGCQFRALYSYDPDTEAIAKLYGTGPTNVYDVMFDKFFKYNSGGKCFAQVHTKHLTVTCDAFTIHNSLWQGKKAANLPNKKDMALVI